MRLVMRPILRVCVLTIGVFATDLSIQVPLSFNSNYFGHLMETQAAQSAPLAAQGDIFDWFSNLPNDNSHRWFDVYAQTVISGDPGTNPYGYNQSYYFKKNFSSGSSGMYLGIQNGPTRGIIFQVLGAMNASPGAN